MALRASRTFGNRLDYQALADLRYQIRRFLRIREVAAREAGVEPQQYLLLLQIKGLEGREVSTVGVWAGRLQTRPPPAVKLGNRWVRGDMVGRRREGRDRREVMVNVRPAGERLLRRLASYSVDELTTEGPRLVSSLNR